MGCHRRWDLGSLSRLLTKAAVAERLERAGSKRLPLLTNITRSDLRLEMSEVDHVLEKLAFFRRDVMLSGHDRLKRTIRGLSAPLRSARWPASAVCGPCPRIHKLATRVLIWFQWRCCHFTVAVACSSPRSQGLPERAAHVVVLSQGLHLGDCKVPAVRECTMSSRGTFVHF